jgi:hypothetical protein
MRSIRKCIAKRSTPLFLAAALGLFAEANAHAAYVITYPGADFSMTPYSIDFGGGLASFTLTDIASTSTVAYMVDAVSTGGNGMVNSFIDPVSFQTRSLIGDTGYAFAAFTTPAGIADSAAETSIGLEFSELDGIHYGFVTVHGPEVVAYGYNSTPGAFIATGVPEAATWVMMIAGLGALGMAAQIKRGRAPQIT